MYWTDYHEAAARLLQQLNDSEFIWPDISTRERIYFVFLNGFAVDVTKFSYKESCVVNFELLSFMQGRGMLVHNHPNGILVPSERDLKLVTFLDSHPNFMNDIHHLIVTPDYKGVLYRSSPLAYLSLSEHA